LSPLSPRLAATTHAALLADLTRLGLPEVAQNSVVIGVTAVLGFKPESTAYRYSEPYPQLPKIEAHAEPTGPACARVDVMVSHDNPVLRLNVVGTYCLVGVAVWQSDDQVVTKVAAAM